MVKHLNQTMEQKDTLFNNILLLCRNTLFYTKFNLIDTFQNRILLIFIHISFIFINIKHNDKKKIYKKLHQSIFDLVFNKIEINMREIVFSDSAINKNMRYLVKVFYVILLNCKKYKEMNFGAKNKFFNKYLKLNNSKNNTNNEGIIEYFNKYETFCFDLSLDSVFKGEIKFNYK